MAESYVVFVVKRHDYGGMQVLERWHRGGRRLRALFVKLLLAGNIARRLVGVARRGSHLYMLPGVVRCRATQARGDDNRQPVPAGRHQG